jgi:MFS transporter, DHA1 family, tetracycline resistance protein
LKLSPLQALFFVCVTDVLGFGIMVPLVPYMAERFGATPTQLTLLLGVYSLCQLIASPVLGRLSDRYGRRPILLASMAFNCLSYLMLGFGSNLWWILASRALGGFMAGNLSAAFAYASDISTPAQRARALGMVGAAIGIGFLVGPPLGGLLSGDDIVHASFLRPALAAAAAAVAAMLLVLVVLPESHGAAQRAGQPHESMLPLHPWRLLGSLPALRGLVIATVLVTTAQSIFESIYALWALNQFHAGPRTTGLSMLALACMAVFAQGYLVRVLVPRWGEYRLIYSAIGSVVLGSLLLASGISLLTTVTGLALLGLGLGLYNPNGSSLASRLALAGNRGAVMGVYTSGTSLARVIGPLCSGFIYSRIGTAMPFIFGAFIALQAAWGIAASRRAAEVEA